MQLILHTVLNLLREGLHPTAWHFIDGESRISSTNDAILPSWYPLQFLHAASPLRMRTGSGKRLSLDDIPYVVVGHCSIVEYCSSEKLIHLYDSAAYPILLYTITVVHLSRGLVVHTVLQSTVEPSVHASDVFIRDLKQNTNDNEIGLIFKTWYLLSDTGMIDVQK